MRNLLWIYVLAMVAGGNAEAIQDQPLEPFQVELLDTAFGMASALPLHPHIKDRARLQEQTVTAALKLDQPVRALRYGALIPNWRKGMAYADYALYCTENGETNRVPHYLELADEASRNAAQDWRRDRVRRRMARTWLMLGDADKAAEFSIPVEQTEEQTVNTERAMSCADEGFATYADQLDLQIAAGGLDGVKLALYAYIDLFGRFYSNPERRVLIENKIKSGWAKMPVFERLDLLAALSTQALEQGDRIEALRLTNEMAAILAETEWPAEYHLQQLAKLAAQQQRCGETAAALSTLEQAMTVYEEQKQTIVNIYRADALIPVAEAYALAGNHPDALRIYSQAADEAMVNPNSRPRAEDLVAVGLSMAVNGVEPDAAFRTTYKERASGLGEPW